MDVSVLKKGWMSDSSSSRGHRDPRDVRLGYTLNIGNRTARCVAGRWKPRKPECITRGKYKRRAFYRKANGGSLEVTPSSHLSPQPLAGGAPDNLNLRIGRHHSSQRPTATKTLAQKQIVNDSRRPPLRLPADSTSPEFLEDKTAFLDSMRLRPCAACTTEMQIAFHLRARCCLIYICLET
ncbi:hypothetical protein CEXT_426851 [Caerostris extrusa]|uniref:Uncharacterized protein n=1 Tax=Caerostris extrusa TaxID=172846 RepID=A0AAV4QW06_CAEEX|nr:hypothetical protein CEXT_426851 [Caerostris extrusa]